MILDKILDKISNKRIKNVYKYMRCEGEKKVLYTIYFLLRKYF